MTKYILIWIALVGACASASPVRVSGLGDWRFIAIPSNSAASQFAQGAEGILNLNSPSMQNVSIAVYQFSQAKPKSVQFAGDAKPWQELLFAHFKGKVRIVNERVLLVHGKWRYAVEYQLKDGTDTGRNGLMMAEAIGDEIKFLAFDNYAPVFLPNAPAVKKLFRDIELSAGS